MGCTSSTAAIEGSSPSEWSSQAQKLRQDVSSQSCGKHQDARPEQPDIGVRLPGATETRNPYEPGTPENQKINSVESTSSSAVIDASIKSAEISNSVSCTAPDKPVESAHLNKEGMATAPSEASAISEALAGSEAEEDSATQCPDAKDCFEEAMIGKETTEEGTDPRIDVASDEGEDLKIQDTVLPSRAETEEYLEKMEIASQTTSSIAVPAVTSATTEIKGSYDKEIDKSDTNADDAVVANEDESETTRCRSVDENEPVMENSDFNESSPSLITEDNQTANIEEGPKAVDPEGETSSDVKNDQAYDAPSRAGSKTKCAVENETFGVSEEIDTIIGEGPRTTEENSRERTPDKASFVEKEIEFDDLGIKKTKEEDHAAASSSSTISERTETLDHHNNKEFEAVSEITSNTIDENYRGLPEKQTLKGVDKNDSVLVAETVGDMIPTIDIFKATNAESKLGSETNLTTDVVDPSESPVIAATSATKNKKKRKNRKRRKKKKGKSHNDNEGGAGNGDDEADVQSESSDDQRTRIAELLNIDPWAEDDMDAKAGFSELAVLIKENPKLCAETYKLDSFNESVYPLSALCSIGAPVELVTKCIDAYEDALSEKDPWIGNPLHYACSHKAKLPVVQALVDRRHACLTEANEFKRFPLHMACMFGADNEVIAYLLEMNNSTSEAIDKEGLMPLHLACDGDDLDLSVIKSLVTAHPGACTVRSITNGWTPLVMALTNVADMEIVKLLGDAHTEVHQIVDYEGNTPLHFAISSDADVEVCQYLVESCPEAAGMKNDNGETPIALAERSNTDQTIIGILKNH